MSVVSAPVDWVESVIELKMPETANRRLQQLMDLNTDGRLSPAERKELEALVEDSEQLSLVRAGAMRLLGRQPQ